MVRIAALVALPLLVTLASCAVAERAGSRDVPGAGDGGGSLGGGGKDLAVSAGPCGVCLAPTPLCDVKTKKCVGCLSDNDCPQTAVCMMSTCMPGCSARHSECGDAGSCDTDMGLCHGCLRDRDCADPKLPYCDVASGRCAACSPQNDKCPMGTYCALSSNVFACVPGCRADIDCQVGNGGGASWACCNHACVDIASAPKNCGGCGVDCKGTACCTGKCINMQNDVKNCGACGTVCPALNAMPSCANGMCGIGACAMGFADCNGRSLDGCEVNTGVDVIHCGACGKVCVVPNAAPLCIGGKCLNGGCNQGFRDCDGNAGNGCEVNILQDIRNCGACNQNCAQLPHAIAGCGNGACVVASCDAGWGNCNGNDNDGCEAALANDPANCGQCRKLCPAPPNVVTSCFNSQCGVQGCVNGFGDCNNNMADGCEARLASDPRNCGGCGNLCGAIPNGVGGCVNGACGLGQCNPGFADCDGNVPNGCEVNINADANNCGGCGKICQQGQSCVAGVCSSPYPPKCSTDKDISGSNYIICAISAQGAWITANNNGAGCNYAALNICKKYGFTRVTRWGGTCGTICGYCGNWTCQSPQGQFALGAGYTTFDSGGGNPVGGGVISCTVHWECAP